MYAEIISSVEIKTIVSCYYPGASAECHPASKQPPPRPYIARRRQLGIRGVFYKSNFWDADGRPGNENRFKVFILAGQRARVSFGRAVCRRTPAASVDIALDVSRWVP